MRNQNIFQDLANTSTNLILLTNKKDMILGRKTGPRYRTIRYLALELTSIRMLSLNMDRNRNQNMVLARE
jgi:hypothetical protein